jgi:predicted aspartyl protease
MYIDLNINDVPGKFLVHTGATISLVSNKIFYALDKSERPEVRQLKQTIVIANGTNLSSIGQSLFNLKMGNQQCGIEAVIADLAIDEILGLDFVQRYNCLIDLRGNVLCFVNEELPLYTLGHKLGTTKYEMENIFYSTLFSC